MSKSMIFDLDGTIGNTLPLCILAFKKAIEPLASRTLTDQEIIDTFGPSEEGTIRALIPSHYEKGIEDYIHHYHNLHDMCRAPFQGIFEILELLKNRNIRLAMVTGKGKRSTDITLEKFGIKPYFELIETGSPLGPSKVLGIRRVLNHFQMAPEESIYVGDAPSDIIAAKEVNIPIVAAAWAKTADQKQLSTLQPNQLFTSLEQFKQYVEKFC